VKTVHCFALLLFALVCMPCIIAVMLKVSHVVGNVM